MWQSNPLGDAPNILNEFRKLAWKPIYLVLKTLETLETYAPVKLQLKLKYNSVYIYKSIYKPQLCNFTLTWRSQVCKVSKNDIPHSQGDADVFETFNSVLLLTIFIFFSSKFPYQY